MIITGDFNIDWLTSITYRTRLRNYSNLIGLKTSLRNLLIPTNSGGSITNERENVVTKNFTPRIRYNFIITINDIQIHNERSNKLKLEVGTLTFI